MTVTYETTIERGGAEVPVVVEYEYWPSSPETREDPGDNAEVEILDARLKGEPVKLTNDELKSVTAEILTMIDLVENDPPEPQDFEED